MHQDDRTPSFPARHAARFGFPFPPLAGADGEDDGADPAASSGTPSPEEQLGVQPPALPFSYDDVPETLTRADATIWLKAREAQMNHGFSQAVGQALEKRREAESALTWQQRLENEATRREAIDEILRPYDIELEWPDVTEEGAEPVLAGDDEFDDTALAAPEVLERVARVEEFVEQQVDTAAEQQWFDHVTSGLNKFAAREGIEKAEGMEFAAEAIPKPIRDTILHHAMQLPRTPEGQLDIEAGVGAYDQTVEHVARAARQGYIVTKDVPAITLGGGSADAHVDLSNEQARLQRGNLIAQRHGL